MLASGGSQRETIYSVWLLAGLLLPLCILLVGVFYFPLAKAVGSSLGEGDGGFASQYSEIASDPVFWTVLRRTFVTAGAVTLICLVLAYPVAEMIGHAPSRLRPFLLALVVVPLWSGVIARTYAWFGIFRQDGVLVDIFGGTGLLFTQTAVIVGMVHVMLPLMILPLYAAVLRYDERLSKASRSLGAGGFRTLWQVKLPALAPQIGASCTAIFVLSLGFFVTPAVLGGPKASMISNLVSQQVFDRVDFARGNALGMVLLVTTLIILALAALLSRVIGRYAVR